MAEGLLLLSMAFPNLVHFYARLSMPESLSTQCFHKDDKSCGTNVEVCSLYVKMRKEQSVLSQIFNPLLKERTGKLHLCLDDFNTELLSGVRAPVPRA